MGCFGGIFDALGYTGAGYWWDYVGPSVIGVSAGWGNNPPYTLADLAAIYPKFFGAPTIVSGTLASGSAVVTLPGSFTGLAAGMLVTGAGVQGGSLLNGVEPYTVSLTGNLTEGSLVVTGYVLAASTGPGLTIGAAITGTGVPPETTIAGFDSSTITLSNAATQVALGAALTCPASLTLTLPATASGSASLTVYPSPVLPLTAIQLYINLATASLNVGTWCDMWMFAMNLFVAHYCTLYVRTEMSGGANQTAMQVAASGLEQGVAVSKSVGDVSKSVQLPTFSGNWGKFLQTSYGGDLVTMAQTVGMGPVYVR